MDVLEGCFSAFGIEAKWASCGSVFWCIRSDRIIITSLKLLSVLFLLKRYFIVFGLIRKSDVTLNCNL